MGHEVIDVLGDGNCFYTCLVKAFATVHVETTQLFDTVSTVRTPPLDEKELLDYSEATATATATSILVKERKDIKSIRHFVADQLARNPQMLSNLFELVQTVPEIAFNYPLLEFLPKEAQNEKEKFIHYCIQRIKKNKVWASEIEHTVVRQTLQNFDIDLITVSIKNQKDIDVRFEMEEKILKSISQSRYKKALVLVNFNDYHYRYMSFNDKAIESITMLKTYFNAFVDYCKQHSKS